MWLILDFSIIPRSLVSYSGPDVKSCLMFMERAKARGGEKHWGNQNHQETAANVQKGGRWKTSKKANTLGPFSTRTRGKAKLRHPHHHPHLPPTFYPHPIPTLNKKAMCLSGSLWPNGCLWALPGRWAHGMSRLYRSFEFIKSKLSEFRWTGYDPRRAANAQLFPSENKIP